MVPWPTVFIYLTIAKYSQENFRSILKTHENHESLALRIFPCLRYLMI